ncbi:MULTISPECIES: sensor histidine kinase [unclassified Dolichospermum]|uniref:sensor histidine kinase n=1 Tax=unclassified Dolichospermum TaxID=2622029 RepID=UPI00144779A8|nr:MULTISPECIES: ATP-binding protein [unclassified Dolichospermum]MTJ15567.1 GHKL domain-containing protein [Dolichospermum sp. UHCC 0299]MTJ39550.1 GHKL domain-containing protein [Dolichospermum sp. UHCC 0406]
MNFISEFKHFSSLKKLFPPLRIRQKIVLGYTLSLGIAVLGTSGGLLVGNSYFQRARNKTILINQEDILLNNLQRGILGSLIHQQKIIATLDQPDKLPKEIAELNTEIDELEIQFTKFQNFTQIQKNGNLSDWSQKYQQNINSYIQLLKELVEKLSQLDAQSNKNPEIKQLILKLYQIKNVEKFSDFAYSLETLREPIKQTQEQANLAYNHALKVQDVIIIVSMATSILIANILALSTSKIITQPILEVTNIARKVTNEENFDLQISINIQDEIGDLANSLNLLIQQVKHLLEIQQAESQSKLIQSEKMSSLGQMLAGIAHEINNPVNLISGNLIHAHKYVDDLFRLLKTYQSEIPQTPPQVQAVAEEIDLEFLAEDIPKLFQSMTIGAERTKEIVRSLKDFVRVDETKSQLLDIPFCLDSTLLILNNRLKNKISVIKNYGEIPQITGYTGLLYQVFMNLLSNAIDAIEEKSAQNSEFSPAINITTERQENDWVLIKIIDNGSGIPPENQQKIFENFFTTKPRGVGTGLGLAITHEIVVKKHQGKITFHSDSNQGTEFTIFLPIYHSSRS